MNTNVPPPYLKIYSERNCGSRFLKQLIEQNLSVKILKSKAPEIVGLKIRDRLSSDRLVNRRNLGWKHAFPPLTSIENFQRRQKLVIVTLTKNPYSFLLSLHKRPYNRRTSVSSFSKFIRMKCRSKSTENFKGSIANPVVLWNLKNRAYLQLDAAFPELPILHIRYEDLLADTGQVVEEIAQKANITIDSSLRIMQNSTKKDQFSFDDYKAYYLQEEWRNKLQAEDIQWINSQLDMGLVTSLGYEPIEPV